MNFMQVSRSLSFSFVLAEARGEFGRQWRRETALSLVASDGEKMRLTLPPGGSRPASDSRRKNREGTGSGCHQLSWCEAPSK
jgi:hypothetical protein